MRDRIKKDLLTKEIREEMVDGEDYTDREPDTYGLDPNDPDDAILIGEYEDEADRLTVVPVYSC